MADPVSLVVMAAANMAASYVVNALFAPKPPNQEGPRLNDRKLQSSTYGNAIPIVYGTYRLAGTVVWGTDLEEVATSSGGGAAARAAPTKAPAPSTPITLTLRCCCARAPLPAYAACGLTGA